MSAAILWIVSPLFVAVVLFFLRRFYRLSVSLGSISAILLAVLALILPIGQEIRFGSRVFEISSVQFVFGRQFAIANNDRLLLSIIFALTSFWFLAAYVARAGRMFIPLGLAIVALLIAALAVEPFLYAGLLIGMAVLASIPVLAPPGSPVARGVLRFLTFTGLGLPMILFTGWMLAGVEARPGDEALISRASALLALGFMLLVGVFPFHSWVLMLSEKAHPYVVAFLLNTIPWMVTLFGLGFLESFTWLQNDQVYATLRLVGVLMVALAGFWSAFERHLGRQMGYAALVEIGFSVVAIGLPGGISIFFAMVVPRAVSLAVWGLGLSAIKLRSPGLSYREVAGLGRSLPLAAAALVLAQLSIAGFPVLAGFPVNYVVWTRLAHVDGFIALGLLLGSIGLIIAALRTLTVLVTGLDETPWVIQEPGLLGGFLVAAILALFVIGIFPQFFLPPLLSGLSSFPQLLP
jgi:formate hydrogenlyase subunit 3/multisubunit Na+/H+ antiporter MnhD subunit